MTLRTRIAAVASLSVALVVLATAVGLYLAVRSDLRGEIDGALRARTRDFIALRRVVAVHGPTSGGTSPAGGQGARGSGGAPAGAFAVAPGKTLDAGERTGKVPFPGQDLLRPGGFPGHVQPAPFGAASG